MNHMQGWRRILLAAGVLCLIVHISAFEAYAESGVWDIGKDGKRWSFYRIPEEPVKDEWIEYEGKEYYLDSSGYMKTGWVTDKNDGNKYYMGEDGAKCFNQFTPDDRYVGPEGTILENFDTYRKAVKKELRKIIKAKEYKNLAGEQLPGFMLMDLNGDEYEDLVVMNKAAAPERVLLAALWDPEEKEMVLSAEADPEGMEEYSLAYNPEKQESWLIIQNRNDGTRDYFMMEEGGFHYDNVWHFTMDRDDWDDPVYQVNDETITEEEWNLAISQAEADAGYKIGQGLLVLTEENMNQAVNRVPTEEQLTLWQ